MTRHSYGGQVWYVILDPTSGRVHRFTPSAYLVIGLMNGAFSVQEIWEIACARLEDDAPTQDETIQLMGQLHAADALQCDVPPDTAELLDRYRQFSRAQKTKPFMNPFAIRIPLFDPERFLTRFAALVRPLFSIWGMLIWLLVTATAAVLAGQHWNELTENVADRLLAPGNLVLLWLMFPVIKALHELGHAFAAKVWGGEVHDMGIMLLVFSPVPYVDVSSSAAFRSRSRRMVVGASGMLVEIFLASLALFVWLNVEPGLVRSMAYNVMLIAGISTVLFNANPLIRYDGYYILSDFLEIPNLAQRANKYFGYLAERYLFGVDETERKPDTVRERTWFVFYAPLSLVYRILLSVGIVMFIAGEFLEVGIMLAVWTGVTMLLIPAVKAGRYLATNQKLQRRRVRAIVSTAIVVGAIVAIVLMVPVPLRTQAEGVVWLPEESFVRAGTDGFVLHLAATPGAPVTQGVPLVKSYAPDLDAQVQVIKARMEELSANYEAVRKEDRVQAGLLQERIAKEQHDLNRARERKQQLTVHSGANGVFVVAQAEDLPGRFVRQGETIAYVVPPSSVTARVVVPQDDIALVRMKTQKVEARLAGNLDRIFPVSVLREVPAASEHLPSKALGMEGGGKETIDPRESSGVKTFSRTFQFDLQLPLKGLEAQVGERVHVRFDHGWEPLAQRWYRGLRQVFLSKLDV